MILFVVVEILGLDCMVESHENVASSKYFVYKMSGMDLLGI